MPTISDILKSGTYVQVDLLTEYPLDSDPATWKKVNWPGYQTAYGYPQVSGSTDNAISGSIDCQFSVNPLLKNSIAAAGVTYKGQNLFVAQVEPPFAVLTDPMDFEIDFIVEPWEGS